MAYVYIYEHYGLTALGLGWEQWLGLFAMDGLFIIWDYVVFGL